MMNFRPQTHAKVLAARMAIKKAIGKQIIEDNKLAISDFNANDGPLVIVGEVGKSDENTLSLNNLILINRDKEQAELVTKPIFLSEEVKNVSLFEGEIIAAEGNMEAERFIVNKVYKPKPITKTPDNCPEDVTPIAYCSGERKDIFRLL